MVDLKESIVVQRNKQLHCSERNLEAACEIGERGDPTQSHPSCNTG